MRESRSAPLPYSRESFSVQACQEEMLLGFRLSRQEKGGRGQTCARGVGRGVGSATVDATGMMLSFGLGTSFMRGILNKGTGQKRGISFSDGHRDIKRSRYH